MALYLEKEAISFAMLSALKIKRPMGITRGKNDIIDPKRIAEFAYRFKDKIFVTLLPALDIRKIHIATFDYQSKTSAESGCNVCDASCTN